MYLNWPQPIKIHVLFFSLTVLPFFKSTLIESRLMPCLINLICPVGIVSVYYMTEQYVYRDYFSRISDFCFEAKELEELCENRISLSLTLRDHTSCNASGHPTRGKIQMPDLKITAASLYSGTSMVRTPMARLPRLFRTRY